ncbi:MULTISPECIES: MutS-related protein [Clostridium]|uniref:lysine 5,6-aminomutase reactivase ATPase KamC n=1 Tax=Clostridium TaxID=1485 RepID=UPI00068F10CA|nr:methionine ABC transporter substrate-binding protein [Clostridium amazonitimonense]
MIKIIFLDKDQRHQVGYSFIIDRVEVITPFGEDLKKNIAPYKPKDKDALLMELSNIEKITTTYKEKIASYRAMERLLSKIKDIRTSINRCSHLNTLDEVELFEIKNFCMISEELYSIYKEFNEEICISNISFNTLDRVLKLLDPDNKKLPTFQIYDSYSTELKAIRFKKRQLEDNILASNDEDEICTLKEERLKWVILEDEEELAIRKRLTEEINIDIKNLENNVYSMGKLDFLIAKGKLALNYNATKPEISDKMEISITNSFNPEVQHILEEKGKSFTPINMCLNSGVSVITGANMGGKSVTLKTIVLNLLLGQLGFFVFADHAKFPILDFIYFISDDLQSVSQGLSTFGAEIIKLKTVIEHAKIKNGFIALDEFARGTNPKEGSFLVKSLCEYLNTLTSISMVCTHYDNVVNEDMVHYQVIGLKNVCFDSLKRKIDLNRTHSIEIIQEHMDYRLEQVSSSNRVPKDALNISVLLGLQEEIVNIAKKYYYGNPYSNNEEEYHGE